MVGIVKLRKRAVFLQRGGDLRPRIAEGLGADRHLQRLLPCQHIAVVGKPLLQGRRLRQKVGQIITKARHSVVGGIQRLQDQIGRTAGAKQ